jgi:hypothetical protein
MLYAIAGNGVGPNAEITKALADLRDKATKDEVDFWLLLEAKDEPTKLDTVIAKWAIDHEIWVETITSTDAAIEGAQSTEQSEDVYGRMLERILERRTEDEDGAVLVLLPPDDAEEDEPLMALIENSLDSQVDVFQLNGSMARLSLHETDEPEPVTPPEPVKATAKKAPAKKAAAPTKKAAKKAAAPAAEEQDGAPNDDDDEVVAAGVVYTEEELKKMGVPELGGIARGQGIDTKALGKRDLITAILTKTAGDEVEEVAPPVVVTTGANLNGHDDVIVIIVPRSKIADLLG